jgi:thymidylate synthase
MEEKVNIVVIIDEEIISENTGKKITKTTPENISFLERLTESGYVAIESQYDEFFDKIESNNKFLFFPCDILSDTLRDINHLSHFYRSERIFVLVGMKMLKMILRTDCSFIENVYLCANGEFIRTCDLTEFIDMSRMIVQEKIMSNTMMRYRLQFGETFETQYMKILKNLLKSKNIKEGRNGLTRSSFGGFMRFDLRKGFPLLTSRKMFFRGIVEELLFFIRGDTNTKHLENRGINIWKGNTSRDFLDKVGLDYEEGMMGPLYGAQWRHFNGEYDEIIGRSYGGIDQLENIVNLIQTDPNSRRIIMTSFNPSQAENAVLYPCHSIVLQFHVENDFLDLMAYSRSIDWFHGAPFNIASYSLLLILIAKLTGHIPRIVNIVFGDSHIYKVHEDACKELINRPIYKSPTLNIEKNLLTLEDIENLSYKDFVINDYNSHEAIKVDMVS